MTRTTRSASGYRLSGFDPAGPILARAPLARLHMAAAGQRLHLQEDLRDPVAHVLVLDPLRLARLHGQRLPHVADQLLVGLIHADHRPTGMVGTGIDFQNVLHAGYECGAPRGGIRQYFFR